LKILIFGTLKNLTRNSERRDAVSEHFFKFPCKFQVSYWKGLAECCDSYL